MKNKIKKLLLILLIFPTFLLADTTNDVFKFWDNLFFSFNNDVITLPEYIANYGIAISGYFFGLLLLFEILIISYKFFNSGFNMQQFKPIFLNFAVSLLIVTGIMYTQGVKTATYTESDGETHTINSRLLVDITSAILGSGSRLADALAYELLFGKMNNSENLFTSNFVGAKKTDELNGYLFNLSNSALFKLKKDINLQFAAKDKTINELIDLLGKLYLNTNLAEYTNLRNTLTAAAYQVRNSVFKNTTVTDNTNNTYTVKYEIKIPSLTDSNTYIFDSSLNYNDDNGDKLNNTSSRITLLKKSAKLLANQINTNFFNNILKIQVKISNDLNKIKNTTYLFNNTTNTNTLTKFNTTNTINFYGNEEYKNFYNTIQEIINDTGTYSDEEQYYKENIDYLLNNDIFSSYINNIKEEPVPILNELNLINDVFSNDFEKDKVYNNEILKTYFVNFVNEIQRRAINYNYVSTSNKEEIIETAKQYLNNITVLNSEMETAYNNAITAINNKTSSTKKLTLNDLFIRSNVLNNFRIFSIFSDDINIKNNNVFNDYIENMSLEDTYEFHWFDLGKYYLGLKTIIGEEYFKSLFYSNIINNNFSTQELLNLSNCLNIDEETNSNNCMVKAFSIRENSENLINNFVTATVGTATAVGFGSIVYGLYSFKGVKGEKGTSKIMTLFKSAASGEYKILSGAIKFLFLVLILNMFLYTIIPMIFWYIGVINWLFKSSIMLVSFCLSFVFLILQNKRGQIINNIFLLIGQSMIPLFLVGMFFLIINMSNILDITIFNAVPLSDLSEKMSSSGVHNEALDFLQSIIGFFVDNLIMLILIVLNFNLYRYLWQVDEFVSEIIGNNIQNTIVAPEKVIRNFTFGAERFM